MWHKQGKKKLLYFLKGTEPHVDINYDFDAVFNEEDNIVSDVVEENLSQ